MPSRTYTINQGAAATVSPSVTILGTSTAGTAGARRRLVHPDSANFPAVVYELNPDRTFNLDNIALPAQFSTTILTLSDRKLVQFDGNLEDVLVTEVWEANGGKAAMTTAFWRELYELYRNPPDFDPFLQTYLQWEPADRSDKVYQVQIVNFTTGSSPGGDPAQQFNVSEIIPPGGREDGGDTQHGLDAILPSGVRAGLVDQSVFLQMKIIAEV